MLTSEQAIERLKAKVGEHPSKGAAADALGVRQSNLSDMLHGKRPFAPTVLEALGLEVVKVTMYREKEKADAQS